MVALAARTQGTFTQAKPVRLPPPQRKPLPFPGPRPLPPAAKTPTAGVLFERYAERIRAAVSRRLWAHGYDRRDDLRSAAEDVTQDTFTRWLKLAHQGSARYLF